MQSCCSPLDCIDLFQLLLSSWLVSSSAAARHLRPLQLLLSIASISTASQLRLLRLLLPDCVRFNSAPRWRPLHLLLPDCIRFNSAPRWRPLHLLLPDCVRFNCCSPIASASAASPRQLFWKIPAMSTILEHSTQSLRFSKLKCEGRASLESSPVPRTSHFRYTQTDTRLKS